MRRDGCSAPAPAACGCSRRTARKIGIIEMPEVCANVAFGGPDLRTLFLTASTSVYTLRVKTPGMPHPWYKLRA